MGVLSRYSAEERDGEIGMVETLVRVAGRREGLDIITEQTRQHEPYQALSETFAPHQPSLRFQQAS